MSDLVKDVGLIRRRDYGAEQALRRLSTSEHFARGKLFVDERGYPNLDRAFKERRRDRAWRDAWPELVVGNLFAAIHELPRGPLPPRSELYQELRKQVRRLVEQDLLGGQTSDQLRRHPEEELPEGEDAEFAGMGYETHPDDRIAIKEMTILAAKTLTERQLLVMSLDRTGYSQTDIAEILEIAKQTVNQHLKAAELKIQAAVEEYSRAAGILPGEDT